MKAIIGLAFFLVFLAFLEAAPPGSTKSKVTAASATDKEFAKALKDTNSPFRLYLRRTDSVGYYKLLAQCREFLKKSHTDTRMSQDIAVMVLLLEKQNPRAYNEISQACNGSVDTIDKTTAKRIRDVMKPLLENLFIQFLTENSQNAPTGSKDSDVEMKDAKPSDSDVSMTGV